RAGVSHLPLDRVDPGSHHRRRRHAVRSSRRRVPADWPLGDDARVVDRAGARRARGEAGVLRRLPSGGRAGASRRHLALCPAQARRDGEAIVTALLSVGAVSKRFRGLLAVDKVSFGVKQGSIFAVIGPNGAGKTTLFNIIAGVFAPDAGSIAFAGERIDGLAPDEICRRGIGRTFQLVRPFPALTVEDNVIIGAMLRRHDPEAARRRAHEVLARLDLFGKRHQLASALTPPDPKRLQVARARATAPHLLLLRDA